jgi:hypothetical protein
MKLNDLRKKYGDMQIEFISEQIEARLNQVNRDIKDILKASAKINMEEESDNTS